MKFLILLLLIIDINVNAQKILKQDILGATYTIDNQEVTKKFQATNYNFKNVLLGKIHNLDVVNPMQLVVHYKQQNTVVILDNQLNAINTINLNTLSQTTQSIYAGLASQNQLWIFDAITKRIGLYSILHHKIKNITNVINEDISWIGSDLNNLYYLTNSNNLYEVNLYGKSTKLYTFTAPIVISYFDKTFTVTEIDNPINSKKYKLNKNEFMLLKL